MTSGPLEVAAQIIESGGVVAAPTDTLIGLLALASKREAVERVLRVKGPRRASPLPVLVSDLSMARRIAELTPLSMELAEDGWPGPLTLVLRALPGVLPSNLLAGAETVGVRVPGSSIAHQLILLVGGPLTGTSANVTGGTSPVSTDELSEVVIDGVDLVLPGAGEMGMASRVVDATGEVPLVLRS